MRTHVGRQVGAVAGVTIATAVLGLAVMVATVTSQEHATGEARRQELAGSRAQRVGALVVDAETSVRGYIITGRAAFLEPLNVAVRELPDAGAQLRAVATPGEELRLARRVTALADAYVTRYAQPTAAAARTQPARAHSAVTSEAGKEQVDAIRTEVAALVSVADRAASSAQHDAAVRADGARAAAIAAGLLIIVTLAILVAALRRRVVQPVVEATEAATRIGAGDLAVRLDATRGDEIGQLSAALNAMAAQLQESADELDAQHTELESQNAELEAQSAELEGQAAELERRSTALVEANGVLAERTVELEATTERLRLSGERLRRYAHVAESLAEVPDVERRATRLLDELADLAGCALGAIWVRTATNEEAFPLVARRGLLAAPPHADAAGDLAARALATRRPTVASHPEGSLSFETLGARVSARHEVHLPLIAGTGRSELLGVVSLVRTDADPFSADVLEALEHLADSSALALYNALVSAQRERQAAMMRAVLASVSEAIIVVTTTGEVVLTNPPMEAFARRLIGIGASEPWTTAQLRTAMAEQVADRDAHDARMAQVSADPMTIARTTIELPRLGTWVHRYTAPVHGPGDELLGRIVVIRDITEERKAEQAKDDLMATVSHELRTPLAAILGFTELLTTREFPADERREYLDTIYQQSVRLSALLDDFLDLQRIERRGLDRTEALDLRPLIDEAVQLYSAQSREHQLSAALADGSLEVRGDADRLRRVIGNLLSNAIKYSPDGGPVRIEAQPDGDGVRVAVVDRGLGIPETLRDRVFDRFFRVDSGSTTRIGGTGLGLALVRDIVLAHGGDVGVESVEGQGSRFWFTLPAAGASPARTAVPDALAP